SAMAFVVLAVALRALGACSQGQDALDSASDRADAHDVDASDASSAATPGATATTTTPVVEVDRERHAGRDALVFDQTHAKTIDVPRALGTRSVSTCPVVSLHATAVNTTTQ